MGESGWVGGLCCVCVKVCAEGPACGPLPATYAHLPFHSCLPACCCRLAVQEAVGHGGAAEHLRPFDCRTFRDRCGHGQLLQPWMACHCRCRASCACVGAPPDPAMGAPLEPLSYPASPVRYPPTCVQLSLCRWSAVGEASLTRICPMTLSWAPATTHGACIVFPSTFLFTSRCGFACCLRASFLAAGWLLCCGDAPAVYLASCSALPCSTAPLVTAGPKGVAVGAGCGLRCSSQTPWGHSSSCLRQSVH